MVRSVPERFRHAWRGVAAGGLFYAAALTFHGDVRAQRGCVIDTPFYEIVNGPAMLLAAAGVPIATEGLGESPPSGWTPPPGPVFHRETLLTSGLVTWMAVGALAGAAIGAAGRKRAGVASGS